MDPKESLTRELTRKRDTCPQAQWLRREGYHYAGMADFVLQHGVWYDPVPFPAGIRKGRAKCCFGNALSWASGEVYRYVEGFILPDHCDDWAIHHAWNLDRDGQLFDCTLKNKGLAYLGVVFSMDQICNAGSVPILDDHQSWFAILREPWTGEK